VGALYEGVGSPISSFIGLRRSVVAMQVPALGAIRPPLAEVPMDTDGLAPSYCVPAPRGLGEGKPCCQPPGVSTSMHCNPLRV
jgi:hypothetical protein